MEADAGRSGGNGDNSGDPNSGGDGKCGGGGGREIIMLATKVKM